MMEEEIQMLFRLSMPEDWRNRMPSTPPPIPLGTLPPIQKDDTGVVIPPLKISKKPATGAFWSDVGLRSYAQMDFSLELSLEHRRCSRSNSSTGSIGNPKKCRRNKNKRYSSPPPVALGGLMYHPDACMLNKLMMEGLSTSDDGDDLDHSGGSELEGRHEGGGDEGECAGEEEVVPPNALCLINILRLTIDCPFADIRKQAANVLFLLKEKGVSIPYALIEGPCTFVPAAEISSIDVDKYCAQLGLSELISERDEEDEVDEGVEDDSGDSAVTDHLDFQKADSESEDDDKYSRKKKKKKGKKRARKYSSDGDDDDSYQVPSRISHMMNNPRESREASRMVLDNRAKSHVSRTNLQDIGFTEYELEAIVARLMGHWVMSHTLWEMILPQVALFLFFFIFSYVYQNSSLFSAFEVPWNMDKPILLGLRLIFMDVMDITKIILAGIMLWFSQRREFEADAFATKLGYGDDLIDALIELNKENLVYPYFDEWYWAFHYSYPSLLSRIEAIEVEMLRMEWRHQQ